MLEEHFEDIFARYEHMLDEEENLLVVGGHITRDELKEQARSLLTRAAERLRGGSSGPAVQETRPNTKSARAPLIQYSDELFRAGTALCRAAMETVLEKGELSGRRPERIVDITLAVQESVIEHAAREALTFHADYLLARTKEVRLEERQRFSRELHDRIAHSMALVNQSLELHAALRDRDAEAAEDKLRRARELSREAMHLARDIALELRQADTGEGLEDSLHHLIGASVPPGVNVKVSFEGEEGHLPADVRGQLYMVLREGLRNAISHSDTDRIRIDVNISAEEVMATMLDLGKGFDPSQHRASGVGLKSMQERVQLLGGSFDLRSAPGRGTRIEARVPLGETWRR